MKKSILFPVFFAALMFVFAFSSKCQSIQEIQSKIEKMNDEMADAMIKGDYEKSLSYYTDDAISLPNYQPMLIGIEAINMANETMANSGAKILSFNASTKKVIIKRDLIVEIGTYNMSIKVPGMDEPLTDVGKYLTVWEKQKDGSLKIKADTWNTDQNPWMQAGGM